MYRLKIGEMNLIKSMDLIKFDKGKFFILKSKKYAISMEVFKSIKRGTYHPIIKNRWYLFIWPQLQAFK
jgi:hypothetical protein